MAEVLHLPGSSQVHDGFRELETALAVIARAELTAIRRRSGLRTLALTGLS